MTGMETVTRDVDQHVPVACVSLADVGRPVSRPQPGAPRARPQGQGARPASGAARWHRARMTSILAAVGAAAALALAAGALTYGTPVAAGSAAADDRAILAVAASSVALEYAPPVDAPVTVWRAFEAPPEPWAAGHRGVDLATSDGARVLAPADGVVSFVGPVAGRLVVVVAQPDGLRSSLEPVVGSVSVGDPVTLGQVIGTLASTSTHCAPRLCVHWGVRDGDTYLDPMRLLPIHGPVVLLPLDD